MQKKAQKKALHRRYFISGWSIGLLCILLSSLLIMATWQKLEQKPSQPLKVAFYEYKPYFYYDENGKPQGYYHEIVDFFAHELNYTYEYVEIKPYEIETLLNTGQVDLVLGAIHTPARAEQFAVSKTPVMVQQNGVYTHEYLRYQDVSELAGQTVGYMQSAMLNEIFRDQMEAIDEYAILQSFATYEEQKAAFVAGELDAMVYTIGDESLDVYNRVYTFSTGRLYFMATKEQSELIHAIDKYIDEVRANGSDPLLALYNRYFDKGEWHYTTLSAFTRIVLGSATVIVVVYASLSIHKQYLRWQVRRNLANGRYCLFYQPVINHATGQVKSVEALLRLQQKGKIMSPYAFLPVIEKADMLYPVTIWIIEQVVKDYSLMKGERRNEQFSVAINVSFRELINPHFLHDVEAILAKTTIQPQQLCFEIVEREKLSANHGAETVLALLQERGFKIAIDDFGTEYSNLDILEKIPHSVIKIDKYLVDTLETSHIHREIISFLFNVAVNMENEIIVEGVETAEQVAFLQQFASDRLFIQGYYYAKPLPLVELQNFLHTRV